MLKLSNWKNVKTNIFFDTINQFYIHFIGFAQIKLIINNNDLKSSKKNCLYFPQVFFITLLARFTNNPHSSINYRYLKEEEKGKNLHIINDMYVFGVITE